LAEGTIVTTFLEATTPGWDWVKDGGLLAVIAILLFILYVLLKLYIKKDADVERVRDEAQVHEDEALVDQRTRWEAVIVQKDKQIEDAQCQLASLSTEFRREVGNLLVEATNARNETANSMRELGDNFEKSVERLIKALTENS